RHSRARQWLRRQYRRVLFLRLLDGLGRDCNGEGRADVYLALNSQFAAHEQHQRPRDRQTEARAARGTGKRGVNLTERLEQQVHILRSDTDAGVGDVDMYHLGPIVIHGVGADIDGTLPRELRRVRDEVEKDLTDADFVTIDLWQIVGNLYAQIDRL